MNDSSRQVLQRQARPSLPAEYWSFVGHMGKMATRSQPARHGRIMLRVFLDGTGGGALNPHDLLTP